jgi:diguanylate cyclase (GGDEF)-like protein
MQSERSTGAFRALEARAASALEAAPQRDRLTGLYDRAWFDAQLVARMSQAIDSKTPITVILADIDGLGAINQAHGEPAGDRVVASVSARLARRLRARDPLARHAGATFAIALVGVGASTAGAVAERLRAGVAEEQHDADGAQPMRVTISLGCVTVERGGFLTRHQLMEAAARALETAKRDGRDRAVSLVAGQGQRGQRGQNGQSDGR